MAKCFHLCIMTAEGTLLDGEAEYCHIPTAAGSVGVLADHAPMLCAMQEGETLCRMEGGEEKTVRHSAGVASVRNNRVTILADRAEL
ncbi:MAG: F0F1 ATP synthase subunit epsilon [Oscillospiraceae bacterium]|nr:F0F1 ATP synthase subunit epsilon [Oscillospiraceae bacterium]